MNAMDADIRKNAKNASQVHCGVMMTAKDIQKWLEEYAVDEDVPFDITNNAVELGMIELLSEFYTKFCQSRKSSKTKRSA